MPGDYFSRVQANIVGNIHLRESQVQGYIEIKDHFDKGERHPAVVVLPTGTGKTGLLAIAPYGLAKKRVLIVAPGLVIKGVILDSLNPQKLDNFWLKYRVLTTIESLPVLVEYEGDLHQEILEKADFVVVNIQKTQAARLSSLINTVPRDFFDVIIIDEAHHSPAQTWVDLEDYFADAKVIKVTGTPFRSDKEPIFGKEVYTYPLGRAMFMGYIKGIIKETWISDELTFQITDDDGTVRTVPYSVIQGIREADWTARQVAYSPSCSRMVVRESIARMREKREATRKAHKIIAVATTIDHAHQICQMYIEEGVQATVVDSSQGEAVNQDKLNDFKHDRYQAIVNVNMLGEGFDHPLISVAAIFRPFRSLLPYAQFAGRALRAIPQEEGEDDNTTRINNTAHLVHHKALGLDDLWEYYRKEQEHALILERFRKITEEIMRETGEQRDTGPDETVRVEEGGLVQALAESFLDDYDLVNAYNEAMAQIERKSQQVKDALAEKGIPATPEILDAIRASQENDYFRTKRPDLDHQERRKRLRQSIEDGVADILAAAGLDPKQEPTMFQGSRYRDIAWIHKTAKTLDGFLITMINDQLRKYIGYERKKWSTTDLMAAQEKVAELLEGLRTLITGGV